MMFLKYRYRLGFESLCAEVAESISWTRSAGSVQRVSAATAVLAIAACEPNAVSRQLGRCRGTVRARGKRFTPNAWPRCATGVNPPA